MGYVILIIIVIALCSIVSSLSNAEEEKKQEKVRTLLEQQTEAATSRNCPHCAETIKKQATKCKHCGSDVEPDLSINFGKYVITTDAYEQLVFAINDRRDEDAQKMLQQWYGIKKREATQAIDDFKSNHTLNIRPRNGMEILTMVGWILFGIFVIGSISK